jgi:hypothetical protein
MKTKIYRSFDNKAGRHLLTYKKYNSNFAYFKYIKKFFFKKRKKKNLSFRFIKKNYQNALMPFINFSTLIYYFNYFFKFYYFKFIKFSNKCVLSLNISHNLQIFYFNLLNKNNNLI